VLGSRKDAKLPMTNTAAAAAAAAAVAAVQTAA